MCNNLFSSIRVRLTGYYAAMLLLILIAFSYYTYKVLARQLRDQSNESMIRSTEGVVNYFHNLDPGDLGIAERAAYTVRQFHLDNASIAFYRDGVLLSASDESVQQNVATTSILSVLKTSRLPVMRSNKRAGMRLAAARVPLRKYSHGTRSELVVVVQAPLAMYLRQISHLKHLFYLEIPIAIFIATVLGYLLTAQTLRPVVAISRQTAHIHAQTLHQRLRIANPHDELGQLAGVINALLTRLDDSFSLRKRLISDASHEIRTPLAIIQGEAEFALSVPRSRVKYQESLAVIRDQSKRTAQIVNDLLVLARSDAGEQALRMEELYLNDIVEECCVNAQSLARQEGVELKYCSAMDDIPFRGDQELLRRMTANLIENAIYYTPADGQVRVSLCPSGDGAEIVLAVEDSGVGISPEETGRVFERFYRTNESRSRSSGGSGLGLAIVKLAAESHQGTVGLTSQLGKGSRFTVTLLSSR